MAMIQLEALYQELVRSRFTFVGRGELDLAVIYGATKREYPALCDDSYSCRDNCSGGHDQPEWKHVVRKALDRLKNQGRVFRGNRRGTWII